MDATQSSHRKFGIEEEYLILDSNTGEPVNRAAELIQAAPYLRDRVDREFYHCQLETATPVSTELDEAAASLAEFRTVMAGAASVEGVVLAGTGMPPAGGRTAAAITPGDRYREIRDSVRYVSRHKYATGMHVHVEVPSRDAGVEVIARLARWAPALLAISANSPFWNGETTGFASWRHVQDLTWPVSGYPPNVADGAEYDEVLERLQRSGIIRDHGLINWALRLSAKFPTVELRIADAQLAAADAVGFAGVVRALVDHLLAESAAGVPRPVAHTQVINGATWLAARDGLSENLIDPHAGASRPAFAEVDTLMEAIGAELDRFGDRDRVERYIERLRSEGEPARRQLAAYESFGMRGVLDLYRSQFSASPQSTRR